MRRVLVYDCVRVRPFARFFLWSLHSVTLSSQFILMLKLFVVSCMLMR